MQHRRVTGDHRLVHEVTRHGGFRAHALDQAVHGGEGGVAQIVDRWLADHRVAHPSDDVRAERSLPVERRLHGLGGSAAQVHERGDHRGRPDVDRDPVHLLARVAGVDVDQVVADHCRGDGRSVVRHRVRELREQRGTVRDLETLHLQRVFHPLNVTPRILQRRRVEFQQEFLDVRLQQDESPDAHRRCLGRVHQSWDLALAAVVRNLVLARQTPAVGDLGLREMTVVGGRRLGCRRQHADLALAARAAARAGRFDRKTGPMRRVEEARAFWDMGDGSARQVCDLELPHPFTPFGPWRRRRDAP